MNLILVKHKLNKVNVALDETMIMTFTMPNKSLA